MSRCAWLVVLVVSAALALAVFAWPSEADAQPCTPVTDPMRVIPMADVARPALLAPFTDPSFPCVEIMRVTDNPVLASRSVPIYSQLQAWNADESLVMISTGEETRILDASTFEVVHVIDWGWPHWGAAIRWSPVEPLALYYVGNRTDDICAGAPPLMRYVLNRADLSLRDREAVGCFPEYESLYDRRNEIHEEMSEDGRYIALMATKSAANAAGYVNEIFAYDVVAGVKSATLELPLGAGGSPVSCDHVQMSPSGRYVVLTCGRAGMPGFDGVEVYDLDMTFLGQIHDGTDHSDLAIDPDGVEWLVTFRNQENSAEIAKRRIPDGHTVALLASSIGDDATSPDGWLGLHVSCRAPYSGSCFVSTAGHADNGWQAREREIVEVHLDSTLAAPHVVRLAHHRSAPEYVDTSACPGIGGYWAQPHQTVSPSGRRILFGSSWGESCFVESYVLDLAATAPPIDTLAPAAPTGLSVM